MTPTPDADTARHGWPGPWSEPDFRRLWLVGVATAIVRWLELLAVAVFVYERTGSAFLVSMMTMLRLLPMGLFGAFLGELAERLDRRLALIGVIVSMLLASGTLAAIAYADALEVWHLGVASFLNGIAWATDNPLRRVMIGDVVGSERMSRAMSMDVGVNNASRMLGPTMGGILLATIGIEGAFLTGVLLYLAAAAVAVSVRHRTSAAPRSASSAIGRIREGLDASVRSPMLAGTFVVTIIFNIFGWPFTSMIPVIGRDQLGLGPQGVGALVSMEGAGAFAGAIAIGIFAGRVTNGRIYVSGVLVYMAMVIGFALADGPIIAGLILIANGIAGAGFSIMQATLVYMAAPPETRSRVLGVLSVCIGVGPIGFLLIGLLAELFGAPAACIIVAGTGLVLMAFTYPLWRCLWHP